MTSRRITISPMGQRRRRMRARVASSVCWRRLFSQILKCNFSHIICIYKIFTYNTNMYVIIRLRSARTGPESSWRRHPASPKKDHGIGVGAVEHRLYIRKVLFVR